MSKNILKIGFMGFGLIGGSIARAVRDRDLSPLKEYMDFDSVEITVYSRSKAPLYMAREDGVIDIISEDPCTDMSDMDILLLCGPVDANIINISSVLPGRNEKTVISDVGSVKGTISREMEKLGLSRMFIGGHPMAGSEKTGYENSSALLLENAYYILTPGMGFPDEKTDFFKVFVQCLGAVPLVLPEALHDYATGAISHLPHCIAAALVHLIEKSDNEDELMKNISAGGFKDTTRIAASSPEMWTGICTENRENIIKLLDSFISELSLFRDMIDTSDESTIYSYFDDARAYRSTFTFPTRGLTREIFAFSLDVKDEAGAISTVASILSDANISICNIGIIRNREDIPGILRIEFYNAKEMSDAKDVLSSKGYVIH